MQVLGLKVKSFAKLADPLVVQEFGILVADEHNPNISVSARIVV